MNRNFFSFFLMCAINLFENVPSLFGTPIIAGIQAEHHKFIYNVAIHAKNRHTNQFEHFCGGSIIGEKYVLSATQCFLKKGNNAVIRVLNLAHGNAIVVAGTNQLSENRIEREIIRVLIPYIHNANLRIIADIAVAELNENLGVEQNPDKLQIIPIWTVPADESETNQIATFCGFGAYTSESPYTISNINRYLNVKLLKPLRGGATIYAKSTIRGATATFGDNGAGLVYNDQLIGVLVRAPPNFIAEIMTMTFMRISEFSNFIERAKNENDSHEDMYVIPSNFAGHPPLN